MNEKEPTTEELMALLNEDETKTQTVETTSNQKGKKHRNGIAVLIGNIEAGVDMTLSISFMNNSLVVTQDGGTGTHGDFASNYPDLYFGYPGCRYFFGTEQPSIFENIWKFDKPLDLKELNFTPKKISEINLISSGRGQVPCERDRRKWSMLY